jgi:predicted MFS family arabinose efflux permease
MEDSAKTRGFIISGLAIVAATFGLARCSFGLFIPQISDELDLSLDVISMIAGGSYIGFLVATLTAGWLSQKFTPSIPILIGGLCAAIGMGLVATSDTGYVLAIAVFIAGASPGFAYPPFSEIIVRRVATERQDTTYAWINSGTGFGVALAGPIVLFATFDWRTAYFVFASLSFAIALWNFKITQSYYKTGNVLPIDSDQPENVKAGFLMVLRAEQGQPLFAVAFCFGLACATYWTFAVDLLYEAGNNDNIRIVFWTVLGVAGIFGFTAGHLVGHLGLRAAYCILMIVIAMAIGSLPWIATSNIAIYRSAAVFGLGFILTTAFLGMWSLRVFKWAPAMGFAMTFFLISLGQGLGPIMIGFALKLGVEMETLFAYCGVLCAILALILPPKANFCPVNAWKLKKLLKQS